MRILFLIITISAATQLPARDVPLPGSSESRAATAHQPCGHERARPAGLTLFGPTLFAPPGRIA